MRESRGSTKDRCTDKHIRKRFEPRDAVACLSRDPATLGGFHSEHYAKGPTRGRCYLVDDEPALVVVVLTEGFTPVKTLIHRADVPPAHRTTDPSTPDHALDVGSSHKYGGMHG